VHNNSPKKRVPPVSFRASDAIKKRLREKSLELKISKSKLILMALDQFLSKQAKTPAA